MLLNLPLRLVPIALTVAMMTTEMPAAIRPYSIAVAPRLILQKRNDLGHLTHSMWIEICTVVRIARDS